MPLDVEFAEPSRIQVRASGEVTLKDIEVAMEEIAGHPRMRKGTDVLVDARAVEKLPSTPELRQVAKEMRPILALGLGAIGIVTDNPVVYGVARMFGVFAESVGGTVSAFREFDEAREWLSETRSARRAN